MKFNISDYANSANASKFTLVCLKAYLTVVFLSVSILYSRSFWIFCFDWSYILQIKLNKPGALTVHNCSCINFQLESFSMRLLKTFYEIKFSSIISEDNMLWFLKEAKEVKEYVLPGCGTSMKSSSQKNKFERTDIPNLRSDTHTDKFNC